MPERAIPREVANEICRRIKKERALRVFSQCWGCARFSKGDFSRMCASSRPDFRGCALVNREFDRSAE